MVSTLCTPKFSLLAKSTPKTGGAHLAHETQKLHENALERIAGMAAVKIKWYGMPFFDRKRAAQFQMVLNLEKIKQSRIPEAYAYRIAVNYLIRLCKEEKDGPAIAVSQLPGPQNLSEMEWEGISAGDKLELLGAKEATADFWKESRLEKMIDAVHDALEKLPPVEAVIVRMYYGIGGKEYSIKEIADCVGYSPWYVKELKGKALGQLEDRLSPLKYAA